MAPLVIEGKTLGEIHNKYNKLVNDAIKNKNIALTEINYDDSDFDNLFKIDIASNNRNVEFILKVLQCTDMLYVSRAIKKSPWLITDKQYAHLINPEYLFNELRLKMTSKAFNKLILQIRLLLRDEKRVEDFYNHYREKDFRTAQKWILHCSQPFIDNYLKICGCATTNNIFKRLCKKSIGCLDTYCHYSKDYYKKGALFETMFVMRHDVERYLDIIESMPKYNPTFTAKYTKIIMTNCHTRVVKQLDKYADCMHLPTFAKFLSQEEIKYLILRNIKNTNLRSWLKDQKVKHLINRLATDVRFEFIKKILIDKEYKIDDDDDSMVDDAVPYRCVQINCGKGGNNSGSSLNIYSLYIFAPFKTAFTDLKKIIRTKSNPKERNTILTVLLTTARHNMQNIHTLLKYYREHHINEPFKFKIQFINIVLRKTKTFRYDKNTWNYLKDIFSSMEVYSKSEKKIKSCVRSVLLYCVINDEIVPEYIEKKFEFETFKQYKKHLSQEEQNKIFNYLFKSICTEIQNVKLQNEKEFAALINILENSLTLLCDWDKDLKDYPIILDRIKHLIEMKKENTAWEMDIKRFYNKKKSWKKLLFAESVLVSPAQDTVMNALKHDAKLIEIYKNKIEDLLKDNKNLDMFFKKLRIYWSQSLAKMFKELLLDNLHQNYNHKPVITGLCNLLPHKEMTEVITKYVPSETKIDWSQHDEVQVYIRKYLAMNLYIARPQPSLDKALLYAKGDYFQYALPSLNAIFYNMSTANVRENLKTVLNSPVSLQKHAIRAALSKLKVEDIIQISSDIWKLSKNSSIRLLIFEHIHNRLRQEKNEQLIKKMWQLIKMFIDTLTPDEDKQIYTIMSEISDVPMCVSGEYCMKSYEYFNSLPAQANCEHLVKDLINRMPFIMFDLDDDFVVNIYMKLFDTLFLPEKFISGKYVATFLLSVKTEEAQMKRYHKMFVPVLTKAIREMETPHQIPHRIHNIINRLYSNFYIISSNDFVLPVKMFTEILKTFIKKSLKEEHYNFITFQKLGLKYITILDKVLREAKKKNHEAVHLLKFSTKYDLIAGAEFGKACVEQLKEDIANRDSSIYKDFAEAFIKLFDLGCFGEMTRLTALDAVIDDKEFIEGHLFALLALPKYLFEDKQRALKNEILNKIGEHPNEDITRQHSFF